MRGVVRRSAETQSNGIRCALALLGLAALMAAPAAIAQDEAPDPLFDDIFDEGYEAGPSGYPDPAETTNRGVFAFNRQVDKWILDPITEAYQFIFPKPVRNAISNFFLNLGSTKTLVNDVLQLEWIDASVTTGRLVVNTTIGIAGFFDVAAKMGLERHESDFGQTLALAGTPSGPYIVLPILGPANVRDGVGFVVDGFFQPTFYILGPADLFIGPTEVLIYSGTSGLSTRDRHYAEFQALRDSSIDFYAAVRSGFYQDRIDAIWGRRPGHRTTEEPKLSQDGSQAPSEVRADEASDLAGDRLEDDAAEDGASPPASASNGISPLGDSMSALDSEWLSRRPHPLL
jgi:phospholipid-binding lipoprotein MlaA